MESLSRIIKRALVLLGLASAQSIFAVAAADAFKVAVWQEPSLPMHPMLVEGDTNRYVHALLAEPLLVLGLDWQWQCRLCVKIPTLENKHLENIHDPNLPYGLKISFELSKEQRWGDGKAVTGFDVLLAWQVANGVKREFRGKALMGQIDHIDVEPSNPRRFTFFFRRSQYLHDQLGSFYALPHHLEQNIWNRYKESANPDEYFDHSVYRTNPENPGLYNGAFLLHKKPSKGLLHLAANPARKHNAARQPTLFIYALAVDLGKKAEVDVLSELACRRTACDGNTVPHGKLMFGDSTALEHIDLNLRNPILRDRKVRQALAYAIDEEQIFAVLRPGDVVPAAGPLHPANPSFSPDVAYYGHDAKMAAKLLDESGWLVDQISGQRKKNERQFILSLITTQDRKRELVARVLATQLEKFGIRLDVHVQNSRVFLEDTLEKMRYEAMILYSWEMDADAPLRALFHSEAIPSVRNRYIGQNLSGWSSQKVDQLLDRLDSEFVGIKREKLMAELQQQYSAHLPGIPLYFAVSAAVISPLVENYVIAGHQFPSSTYAASWNFSKENLPAPAVTRADQARFSNSRQ